MAIKAREIFISSFPWASGDVAIRQRFLGVVAKGEARSKVQPM
jgi:hypothetical protein